MLLFSKDNGIDGTITPPGDTINNKTLLDELQESEDLQLLNDDFDITIGVEVFEVDGDDSLSGDDDLTKENRRKSTTSLVSLRTCGTIQTENVMVVNFFHNFLV